MAHPLGPVGSLDLCALQQLLQEIITNLQRVDDVIKFDEHNDLRDTNTSFRIEDSITQLQEVCERLSQEPTGPKGPKGNG